MQISTAVVICVFVGIVAYWAGYLSGGLYALRQVKKQLEELYRS